MASLYNISKEIEDIYFKLRNGEGVDEDGVIDDEVINSLTIKKEELQTKAIDYAYVIKQFENDISVYDNEIKRLMACKKQMMAIHDRLKSLLTSTLLNFGIVKLQGKTVQLSFRESKSVEITDERMINPKFMKVEIKKTPDKMAIRQALESGEDVQGVDLVTKKNLQIK